MCVRERESGGVKAKSSWASITLYGAGVLTGGRATEGGRHKERERQTGSNALIRHGDLDGTE